MNTKKFKTRTEQIMRNNVSVDGKWEIAIDIGYSSVKLFSNNIVATFPSYAKKVGRDFDFITSAPDDAILYKNLETGEQWLVGSIAQERIETGDITDSEAALYGRRRYADEMFKVYVETGIGFGMQDNAYGAPLPSDDIIIQTGLPEKYMSDAPFLIDAFEGKHKFALKIGKGDWIEYNINIRRDNVFVISQPRGTFFSVCFANNGEMIKEAKQYQSSNIIVLDPGFGTFDIFTIMSGSPEKSETFSNLGMKRVLQETIELMKEKFNIEVSVPAMQKYLSTGEVYYEDIRTMTAKKYSFEELLQQANTKVCEEAYKMFRAAVPNILDYQYVIITGGTGAAWYSMLEQKLSGYPNIQVIKGNQNDSLSSIYSNVRGYYHVRHMALKKES